MKKAFTLVEMLVVIGIIAVLTAAAAASYSHMTKQAKLSRGQELVDNVYTALNTLLNNKGMWPKVVSAEGAGGNGRMRETMTKILLNNGLMSIVSDGKGTLLGTDRYGIVDPWAEAVLKDRGAGLSRKVTTGGTVEDHILYFAVDGDGDGITDVKLPGGSLRVRANVCVWSTGPNGVLDDYRQRGRSDDIYSWSANQIVE